MHLHLDAVGGVAGDMFIAALLDAFPEHRPGLLGAIRAAGVPEEVTCSILPHRDHALTGMRFQVDDTEASQDHHVPFAQVRDRLVASALDASVQASAIDIFTLLAQAEARVHGRELEQVSFHELGAWDSIADVVGAAYLISRMHQATWSVSALPMGSGRVKTAHGPLPVPAPATTLLLEGFQLIDDGVAGERVTPTGASILRYLNCAQRSDGQVRKLVRTGIGFGTRWMPGLSNVLRVLVLEPSAMEFTADQVAQIEFEIDDQSPEDLAIALDRLRAHTGVLDVLQFPALGKKGRMSAHIQVLANPACVHEVGEICFRETTTIGFRQQMVSRRTLARRSEVVNIGGRDVHAKLVERPGATTVKIESDDLAAVSGERSQREQVRHEAEAIALKRTT
jgi:pyridinium-3,5-bisthiocarboxylic acid mononucleotide nickel chelatase